MKPSSYLDFVLEQLNVLGKITAKSMFGGQTLYCEGIVFGLIADDTLYLKADEANRAHFLARNLPAFRPFEGTGATMQYYQAPPEIFEDTDALRTWAGAAVEVGRRRGAKKRTRAGSTRRKQLVN